MFCNYCGTSNPDDSNFCSKCGKALNKQCSTGSPATTEEIYTVEIFRVSQMYLLNPGINISVDGDERLSIDNGKSVKLRLPRGKHIIIFSALSRKKEIEINLDRDTLITLKWNRLTGAIEAVQS